MWDLFEFGSTFAIALAVSEAYPTTELHSGLIPICNAFFIQRGHRRSLPILRKRRWLQNKTGVVHRYQATVPSWPRVAVASSTQNTKWFTWRTWTGAGAVPKCDWAARSQCGSKHTGLKQCTFNWLISNDITQNVMVLNSLILHHLIVITFISYKIILTISLPTLINIAPL